MAFRSFLRLQTLRRLSLKLQSQFNMADESTTSSVRVPAVDKEEYSKLCAGVNAIAQPLAGRRTAKKIYKVLQVAMKEKNETMRQGLAEVMKGLRKEEKGLVILAG